MKINLNERAYRANRVDEDADIDCRLLRALESAPAITVPEDFALRVAGMVPASVAAARRANPTSNVGTRVAWAVLALLLVVTIALAPSAVAAAGTRRWLEFVLEVELVALSVWLSFRPRFQS